MQHTYLIFSPNLNLQGIQMINFRCLNSLFTPPLELKIGLKLYLNAHLLTDVQMQTTALTHLSQSYALPTPETVQK